MEGLESIVKKVIKDNPVDVHKHAAGDHGIIGKFMGMVMIKTKGLGEPKEVNRLIQKYLTPLNT